MMRAQYLENEGMQILLWGTALLEIHGQSLKLGYPESFRTHWLHMVTEG